jgi:hypothetical protein
MPVAHRPDQQRIIPERSVSGYRERGWTIEGEKPPEETPEPPVKSAAKADWAAYADTQGIDTTGMTKAEIIAATEE